MKEIDLNGMLVFDFSNLNLQENSTGNCFGCDSGESNKCDSCDYCDRGGW